jgi:DNA-binding Lrp family transcriptional regulator
MLIKIKMELPYEPMKRTTTALKQEKEEAFMMVAAFYRTTGRNENKYYCKCTIENDGIFNYATSYYYRNPNLGKQIPTLSNADYLNFKQFLKLRKSL